MAEGLTDVLKGRQNTGGLRRQGGFADALRSSPPAPAAEPAPLTLAAPPTSDDLPTPKHEPASVSAPSRFPLLPIDDIYPDPKQARQNFDQDALEELVESIKVVGVLQPVLVRDHPDKPGEWVLIAGERRLRASRNAGLTHIPAHVMQGSDSKARIASLIENLMREPLNPIEEAAGYKAAMEDGGLSQEALASQLGIQRTRIAHTVRLLNLPDDVKTRVAAGVLTMGHARALCGVVSPIACSELATRIIAEGMSVRAVEELISMRDYADGPTEKKKRKSRETGGPEFADVAIDRIADRLETRVKITGNDKRGRIVVEYAGEDDFVRLVQLLAPEG